MSLLSLGLSNPVIASYNDPIKPAIFFSNSIGQQTGQAVDPLTKVEPLVLQQLDTDGKTDFFVWLKDQPVLNGASTLNGKEAKEEYVFNTLQQSTRQSQAGIVAFLDEIGASYQTFTVVNRVFIRGGDRNLVITMASRPDVDRLTANHISQLDLVK